MGKSDTHAVQASFRLGIPAFLRRFPGDLNYIPEPQGWGGKSVFNPDANGLDAAVGKN
jgi:hypothetical protein